MNTQDTFEDAGVAPRIWPVGELCVLIADVLQAQFNPVQVQGEVSSFTRASSGHCYFNLKDATGQLRCAMFKRAAGLLPRPLKDGDLITAKGNLGVYAGRGDLQLVVESVQTSGQGNLFEEFLKIKARLLSEGLFDPEKKRAIPPQPKGIGVVTSLGAAACHDVMTAFKRRVPHLPILIAPALVQGADAPRSIALALRSLYAREDIDVILVVRGGGSMEDLWCFNDERLARVVAQSPYPLISGVGHETDFTIIDFCADLRAATPTAAAELCATPTEQLELQLQGLAAILSSASTKRLDQDAQRLDTLQLRLGRPSLYMSKERSQLQLLEQRLKPSVTRAHERARSKIALLTQRWAPSLGLAKERAFGELGQWEKRWRAAKEVRLQSHGEALSRAQLRLKLLDPSLVLQRGYAWLSDEKGIPVTSRKGVAVGQNLSAQLSDGAVLVKVVDK
jgi:exodeoxyribonuclease VII large subunit